MAESLGESNRVVPSLLDRLRCPSASDLARKRKIKTNPPSGNKGAVASEPHVSPSTRVRDESLKVLSGKLFCNAYS